MERCLLLDLGRIRSDPVKWQAAWRYNCATAPADDGHESDYDLSLRLSPRKFKHGALVGLSDSAHFCDVNAAYDATQFQTPFAIQDGVPVTIYGESTVGATNVCDLGAAQITDGKVDVAGKTRPRLAPGPEAPDIKDGYESVEVLEPDKLDDADLALYDGYVPAVVSWPSNSDARQTCAWVNWDEAQ